MSGKEIQKTALQKCNASVGASNAFAQNGQNHVKQCISGGIAGESLVK
jgi:hypothetical protein